MPATGFVAWLMWQSLVVIGALSVLDTGRNSVKPSVTPSSTAWPQFTAFSFTHPHFLHRRRREAAGCTELNRSATIAEWR